MKNQYITLLAAVGLVLTACGPAGKTTDGVQDLASVSDPSNSEEGIPSVPMLPETLPVVTVTPVDPFPNDAKTFNSPWSRTDTQIIIDAYQGNSIDWNKMASDKRVTAVIHRSTSGSTVDTQYAAREKVAKARGYLWGAYHLGKSGDPITQAKLFLKTIGNKPDTLMFLDLEDTSNSTMMNVPNAKKFLNYVFQQTGKWPVVYANSSVTMAINAAMKNDPTFQKTRLWYARFKSNVTDFHSGNSLWPTYFLWQFSSEINCSKTGTCLYNVPGTAFDMDINVFYGSFEALKYQWSL